MMERSPPAAHLPAPIRSPSSMSARKSSHASSTYSFLRVSINAFSAFKGRSGHGEGSDGMGPGSWVETDASDASKSAARSQARTYQLQQLDIERIKLAFEDEKVALIEIICGCLKRDATEGERRV